MQQRAGAQHEVIPRARRIDDPLRSRGCAFRSIGHCLGNVPEQRIAAHHGIHLAGERLAELRRVRHVHVDAARQQQRTLRLVSQHSAPRHQQMARRIA